MTKRARDGGIRARALTQQQRPILALKPQFDVVKVIRCRRATQGRRIGGWRIEHDPFLWFDVAARRCSLCRRAAVK
ncbi:MAG: hypothetical protein R3F04_10645 [Lysobacteraceae bacterium]